MLKGPIAWSRPEPFGAWVRLDDATLIAVDHALAERLAVPHGDQGISHGPLEHHLSVTSRCAAPCQSCYLDARPDGASPSFDALVERLRAAAKAGASTVALGGGEPLVRDDLGALANEARRLGLVPVLTTSGIGMTRDRARDLRAFAQINVSHDGVEGAYREVRGFDGEGAAERAMKLLYEEGVPFGVNVVLTRRSFPHVEQTADAVARLGAREVQLLRYKPAGRAANEGYADQRLSPSQIEGLYPLVKRLSDQRALHVRIDCALVPLLSKALLAQSADVAQTLMAWGVFGCEAGRHLGATTSDGREAPCSMFTAPLAARSLLASAAGMRAYHADPPEPCRGCPLRSVCRGGCQVVSLHTYGAFAPDPECPRVLSFAEERRG